MHSQAMQNFLDTTQYFLLNKSIYEQITCPAKTIKANWPKLCHPNHGVYWKWQLCVYQAPWWFWLWKFCSNRESEWGTSNKGFNSLQYRTWMAINCRWCLSSYQTWFLILICSNSSCSTKSNSKCCAVLHVIYSWLLKQDLPMFVQIIYQPMPRYLKKNTMCRTND